MIEIERCRCGHDNCRSYEFSNAHAGKFLPEDAAEMAAALERFLAAMGREVEGDERMPVGYCGLRCACPSFKEA